MTRLARMRDRAETDDEGNALIIALVFITVFGLLMAAILSFSDTSLRAADAVQSQRLNVYAADGAVEATIAAMRYDVAEGTFGGTPCNQTIDDVNDTDDIDVSVTCTPHPGSGTGGSSGGGGIAIITNPSAGEYGIYKDSNGILRVGGDIYTNGSVTLPSADAFLDLTGSLKSTGPCSEDKITASGGIDCSAAVTSLPTYSAAITSVPATQPVPACLAGIATFVPNRTYTDAAALSALTSGTGACSKGLLYFPPGAYYFDFPSGSSEWLINDKDDNVVGGVPSGWSLPGLGGLKPTIPDPSGACNQSLSGVQFVFGGTSRLYLQSGKFELCGVTGSGSTPGIAVFGSTASETSQALAPTTAGTSKFDNVNPGAFVFGDGGVASVSLDAGESASATVSGFGTPAVPAGATISAVTLRVAHRDQGSLESGSVKLTKSDGTSCTFTLAEQTKLTTETFDAKTCLSTAASFSGVSATYSVLVETGRGKKLTASLDGIALDVTYVVGGIAPPSGCITQTPFPTSGSDGTHCALIKSSGAQSLLSIHGMVYAPRAAIDLAATNASAQTFSGGIVARTFRANVTPASTFTGQLISVPGGVSLPNGPRIVDLVASVPRPGGGTEVQLRATVRFVDQPSPGTSVEVLSWDVER